MKGFYQFIVMFYIVPISLFLAISLSVFFTIRKTAENPLKVFGYAIAALLLVSAAVVFSLMLRMLSVGNRMQPLMQPMMQRSVGSYSFQGHR